MMNTGGSVLYSHKLCPCFWRRTHVLSDRPSHLPRFQPLPARCSRLQPRERVPDQRRRPHRLRGHRLADAGEGQRLHRGSSRRGLVRVPAMRSTPTRCATPAMSCGRRPVYRHPSHEEWLLPRGRRLPHAQIPPGCDPKPKLHPQRGDPHARPDRTTARRGQAEGLAPYVGIGWDTLHTSHGGFGWKVLAGAVFSPRADVSLNLTGPAGNTVDAQPAVQAYLQSQEAPGCVVPDHAAYLLIQIGAGWRF